MGATYYYYYELDGSTETYDSTLPSTTKCPYLPGQPINTLTLPTLSTSRHRSASMSSLRLTDYTTMRPNDRFVSPRAAPSPSPCPSPSLHPQTSAFRFGYSTPRPGSSYGEAKEPKEPKTIPNILRHKASSRSLSPAPSWRRFFRGFRERSNSDRDRSMEREAEELDRFRAVRPAQPRSISYNFASQQIHAPVARQPVPDYNNYVDVEPFPRSDSRQTNRSREISPESLRRFLVDDLSPVRSASSLSTVHPAPICANPEVYVTPAPFQGHAGSHIIPSSRPVSSRSARSFTLPTGYPSSLLAASPLLAAPSITSDISDIDIDIESNARSSLDLDDEDDDNFASPIIPETPMGFTTFLSPPPAATKRVPVPLDSTRLSTASYKLSSALHSPTFASSARFTDDVPELTGPDSTEVSPSESRWGRDAEGSLSSLSTIDCDEDMAGVEFDDGLYLREAGTTGKGDRELEWIDGVARARVI